MSTLPRHDPSVWPLRMSWKEIAQVWPCSRATFFHRVKVGLFPKPDGDRMWARATVIRYLEGGIQRFDEQLARESRRQRAGLRSIEAAQGSGEAIRDRSLVGGVKQ
jgi:hypothetical protein